MIYLIFAMDQNNLIGKGNELPWHYSSDLKYFKEKTLNKTVVMGKNTFYSIYNRLGKPLPNRKNIVATFNRDFKCDDVLIINDLIGFLEENAKSEEEIFVIGGKQIYDLAMPYAKRLYITHINKAYVGDIYFSEIDYSEYEIIERNTVDELDFIVYQRCQSCF